MTSFFITYEFYKLLREALPEWKSGSTREKVWSVTLEGAKEQQDSSHKGRKNLFGRPCIPMSSRRLAAVFPDYHSRKKYIQWVTKHGLVVKDRSWVSSSISEKAGQEPYCDSWHFTEPDFKGKRVKVQFDETLGLFGVAIKSIRKAEGHKVKDNVVFSGVWAIDEYNAGKLKLTDLMEVGKTAHILLKGSIKPKGPSCRIFDAFTLCKKDLRSRCFTDSTNGKGAFELCDLPGAATFTAPLAGAVLGIGSFQNKDLHSWAYDLRWSVPKDPYKGFFDSIREVDRKTNVYGENAKWTKAVRKTMKMDFQCVANCSIDYLIDGKRAYHEFFTDHWVSQNKRRQWVLFHSIRKRNKALWDCIVATKKSGLRDAFYRLHTMGEKMVMGLVIDHLRSRGYTVFRVHDAIWTCDERLAKTNFNKVLGQIFLDFVEKDSGYGRSALTRLAKKTLTKDEMEWARQGLVPPTEREKAVA